MTRLDEDVEALKLENVSLRERVTKLEGAFNVLNKRILEEIRNAQRRKLI